MMDILAKFATEVLFPRMEEMNTKLHDETRLDIKQESASLRHELKDYIDVKLTAQTDEIFKRVSRRFSRGEDFNFELLDRLQKRQSLSTADIKKLKKLLLA